MSGPLYSRHAVIQCSCTARCIIVRIIGDLTLPDGWSPSARYVHILMGNKLVGVDWKRMAAARHGMFMAIAEALTKLDISYSMPNMRLPSMQGLGRCFQIAA